MGTQVLAFVLALVGATNDPRIGSFVSGERPMYLEIDQLVAAKPFHLTVRNVPSGSAPLVLLFSNAVDPIDLTSVGIPGVLGPDLTQGGYVQLADSSVWGVVPLSSVGQPLYLQALVVTPNGKRLSSMVQVEARAKEYDDDRTGNHFPLPLITQEILPKERAGLTRVQEHVRVGIPLPRGAVPDLAGMPALTLQGPVQRGQFSTLTTWPDGSVKWALIEYFSDVAAGSRHQDLSVDHGPGNFGGADLATTNGSEIVVNAGRVAFKIRPDTQKLFQYLTLDGNAVIDSAAPNGFQFIDCQNTVWTFAKTGIRIRRNGPVRAELQVDGMFTRDGTSADDDRIYVRAQIEAFAGQPDVRVQVSLRNTSLRFPEQLLFRGFRYYFTLNDRDQLAVRFPSPSKNGLAPQVLSGAVASDQSACFEEQYINHSEYNLCTDPELNLYYAFVQRLQKEEYAREGVRARIASTWYTGSSASNYFTSEGEFANPLFMEVNSGATGRGVLLVPEHAAQTWPIALGANGNGQCIIKLFPEKLGDDTYDYPLTYASSETRTFHLLLENTPAADPRDCAEKLDYPLFARAPLWVYNQSGVWPWRLVTHEEAVEFTRHVGFADPDLQHAEPSRRIFRYAGGTGGSNNNWGETRDFYEWLRLGHGGAWLSAWFEAFYKVDKIPWTFDDGRVRDRQEIRNPDAPVTDKEKFYDGSKHMFAQALADVALTRGETYLLDSTSHFAETFLDPELTSVQTDGNYVAGYYGAVGNSALAVLEMQPHAELQQYLLDFSERWVNLVFKQANPWGVDTYTKGWQAPLGTAIDGPLNPDGYYVSKSSGKQDEWNKYGYTIQIWSAARHMGNYYLNLAHYLEERAPTHPLIGQTRARGPDMYHFLHRPYPDDFSSSTGDAFLLDLFDGDAGNEDVDPFVAPGRWIGGDPDNCAYVLHGPLLVYLDQENSESAYSYGVEVARSLGKQNFDAFLNDPVLNEFVMRYLKHYGLN